ncbi:ABC transporter permease [Agromyces aerolatus]|uniref:ABC transporter permease n=1 Tax=Agromyces sp. LY-1074 TaxID=3074080 RepID=UPI002861A496|nr:MULTISPECIES: ABC transporter permease [unclassified Agromyces]MDR5700522.1 ABC transporter permease [Agromyces sp. LY-1074]MDR5707043.1 ABC transporter permease [Agromyces sp. LY-1358]
MSTTLSRVQRVEAVTRGGAFVLRRLITAAITLLGVTLIVFFLTRGVGDPVYILQGSTPMTPEQLDALRQQYGLDRPIWVQYLDYLGGLLQGDLGTSLYTKKPVTTELAIYFPATLSLSVAALILGVIITVPLGVVSAIKPGSFWNKLSIGFTRFGVAMPSFWFGLLLVYVFVYVLKIAPAPTGQLPIGMATPPRVTGVIPIDALLAGEWDVFGAAMGQLALPVIALALTSFPALLALTESVTARVLRSDYMRTARATGLPPSMAYGRYAARNIASPIVTQIAMTFGFLLGGTVLVEFVFSWPGIGQYAVLSMQRLDFAPVIGIALLTSTIYLVLYFISDLISLALDPRIRHDS